MRADGHAGFEEVRGVAVAEGVHVGPLVDAAALDRPGERALERRGMNRRRRRSAGAAPARVGGKEPDGIAMRAPEVAEQREGGIRKRDESIAAAFSAADVEQLARAVDRPALGAPSLPGGEGRTRT